MLEFSCAKCNEELEVSREHAGEWVECPECGEDVRAPRPRRRRPATQEVRRDSGEPRRERRRRPREEERSERRRRPRNEAEEEPPRRRRQREEEEPPRKRRRRRDSVDLGNLRVDNAHLRNRKKERHQDVEEEEGEGKTGAWSSIILGAVMFLCGGGFLLSLALGTNVDDSGPKAIKAVLGLIVGASMIGGGINALRE